MFKLLHLILFVQYLTCDTEYVVALFDNQLSPLPSALRYTWFEINTSRQIVLSSKTNRHTTTDLLSMPLSTVINLQYDYTVFRIDSS